MARKLPVDFEQKVKSPPPVGGRGYPYQLSAKDLMTNFRFLSDIIPEGTNDNEILYFSGNRWQILQAPSGNGTFVLGAVDGKLTWMDTEACA